MALVTSGSSSGDCISFSDILDVGTGNYSFSVWLKLNETQDNFPLNRVCNKSNSGSLNDGNGLACPVNLSSTKLSCPLGNYNNNQISGQITRGIWIHVVVSVTRDSGVRFYINGDLFETVSGSVPSSYNQNNTGPFVIGASWNGSSYIDSFAGKIAHFHQYNRDITEEEAVSLFNQNASVLSGLQAYWPLISDAMPLIGGEAGTIQNSAYFDEEDPLPTPEPPINTIAPVVSGIAQSGEQLSCTTGTWSGTGTLIYEYQWTSSDNDSGINETSISGATNNIYVLTNNEVGKYIRCIVTVTDDIASVSEESNFSDLVISSISFRQGNKVIFRDSFDSISFYRK